MTKATILSNSHQKQPKRSRQVREYGIDDDYYTYYNIVVMNKHLLPTPGSVTRIDRKDVEEVIESLTTTIRTKNCKKCLPDVHCALGESFWGNNDEDKEYKKNLNQVVASGRILDQDTLRVSQIKQNDNHQTNRHSNNRRPWNHAKRFLSSYQPSE
jgi:hypothetical protein